MVVQRECRCLVCELCLKVCRVFVLPCWQNSVFWGNKKYSRNFGVMCFYLLAYVMAPVSPWHRVTSTSAFQKTCKMSIISISLVSTWCKQTEQQYFWHKPVWLPAHPIGYRSLMSGCVSPKVYFLSTAPFFFTYYQHNIITHIDFYTHKKYKVTLTCLFPGGDPDVQLTECDRRSGVHLLHSFPGQSVQGNRPLHVTVHKPAFWIWGMLSKRVQMVRRVKGWWRNHLSVFVLLSEGWQEAGEVKKWKN